MERRTLLKCLLLVAGGSAVLPACLHKQSKASIVLNNMSISAEQEATLGEIAETLIPASATPGAKDTYAHLYALRMLDDCYEKEEQETFLKGLKAVDELTKEKHNTSFAAASAAQKKGIVSVLEAKKASADAQAFYQLMKQLTIQGYTTSKPVMGAIFKYELVPGRYVPAFPAKAIIHQA
jgi:hypothetical protein